VTTRYRFPGLAVRRLVLAALVVGTSAGGSILMLRILGSGGLTLLELTILALFVPTFTWIVVPFWISITGFVLLLARRDPNTLERDPASPPGGAPPTTRTAIAVPVFDERADEVAARVSAMLDSLAGIGEGDHFDVHILSDSRDAGTTADEREHVDRLRVRHPSARIHYRHRAVNAGRKAGNIAEFTARSRDDYDFMVVLDADSLMSGETLLGLVQRMEANPDVGLIQTPTGMIRARSLFARLLQFAGAVYGPVLAAGQAFWQGPDANYFGHNAIVRMAAFEREARLPVLAGDPPLGGEILSHDFVEAALLRRAGWKVVLEPALRASWEELPESFPAYARRDRRWAQGSLQHLRLLRLEGLRAPSLLHFLSGAMAYVSSPLWLGMLLAGTAYVFLPSLSGSPLIGSVPVGLPSGVSLLIVTVVVLFLPKVLGVVLTLLRDARRFGGAGPLLVSALVETALSVALAPVLMVHHSVFVGEIVKGEAVGWNPRDPGRERIPFADAVRITWPAWAAGVVWTVATLVVSPVFALWLSPILAGLLLAPVLVAGSSGAASGGHARRWGLLRVPCEVVPPPEVAAVDRGLIADPGTRIGVLGSIEGGAHGAAHTREGVMYNAERGLFDLKRGRALRVGHEAEEQGASAGRDRSDDVLAVAAEGLDASRLMEFRALSGGPPTLVVTSHRARLLGWCSEAEAQLGSAIAIPLGSSATAAEILALAMDPGDEARGALRGRVADRSSASALSLARLGRLLPAVVTARVGSDPTPALVAALESGAILAVSTDEVCRYVDAARSEIVRVSEAPVPIPGAESSTFVLFREACGLEEHVAVLVGERDAWPDPVPIRLHSACLTGDLFGSLRCDCGEQLRGSMDYFASRRGGILLYLAQEGRGIGLGNKFRAYSLQETGLDTIDADGHLGFGADEREYEIAISMLRDLDIHAVEVLTNNPDKVSALEAGGISVVRRQPLFGHLNRHNLPYVRAKAERAGHWLREMLAQPVRGDRVAGD
jgi:membrane glycosyltransferase